MPIYKNISQAIRHNSKRQCKVEGCFKHRSRISGYCQNHTTINQRWGSPYHTKLLPRDYDVEREQCRTIIDLNHQQEHRGIVYAVNFLDRWLNDAHQGKPGVVSAEHFRRLKDAGITGKQILIECCALWLFADLKPQRIRDSRHLTYVLGSKIIRLSPFGESTRGPEHRAVGEYLRRNLGRLFVSVAMAVKRKEVKDKEVKKVLDEPLDVS